MLELDTLRELAHLFTDVVNDVGMLDPGLLMELFWERLARHPHQAALEDAVALILALAELDADPERWLG